MSHVEHDPIHIDSLIPKELRIDPKDGFRLNLAQAEFAYFNQALQVEVAHMMMLDKGIDVPRSVLNEMLDECNGDPLNIPPTYELRKKYGL